MARELVRRSQEHILYIDSRKLRSRIKSLLGIRLIVVQHPQHVEHMAVFSYQEIMHSETYSPSFYIPPNELGRQLVISDIHGCAKTFKALVTQIELTKSDQLFLLGDYIDKGPDHVGVVDFILDLLAAGYQVFPLRGNHEQMLIKSHKNARSKEERRIPRLNKRRGLVDANFKILPKYENFFLRLPFYYELDHHYLVHAGFNLALSNPFKDFEAMLWTTDFEYDGAPLGGKTVVIGHVSTILQFIKEDVSRRNPLITLDNGCVYKRKWFRGNLLCLDLNAWKLTIQANIDD